jgi:hypothetical protein
MNRDELNILDELEAKLEASEAEWDPATTPRAIGYVDGFDTVTTKDGTSFPVIRLRERDGSILRIPAGRAVLSRRLVDERVQIGDAIAIEYRGKATSKTGREFHDYMVRVGRIGERRPGDAFTPTDDLGLVPGIGSADGTFDGAVPF